MPDSPTDCGEPVALSKIIRLPVSSVVSSSGVKMTDTLHFLPGASVLSHCDFTVKTDGDALSIVTLTGAPIFFLPLFLIVTCAALLGFPTAVFAPKLSDEGLIDSVPTGVAVARGAALVGKQRLSARHTFRRIRDRRRNFDGAPGLGERG